MARGAQVRDRAVGDRDARGTGRHRGDRLRRGARATAAALLRLARRPPDLRDDHGGRSLAPLAGRSGPFPQRFTGTFSDDDRTIAGLWEKGQDASGWETDFDLTYRRVN